MKNRVIFSDNTALTDYTVQLNNYGSADVAMAITASEDEIFIGSPVPFNSIYFEIGTTANASSCDLSVYYYDGTEFNAAVEVIDETAVSGKTMAQSGYVMFTPDKDHSWGYRDTQDITELASKKIYDLYWTYFKFSQNINFSLKWVGNVFSDDSGLEIEMPDLVRTSVLTNFKTGKTNWKEQHIQAAELLVNGLKSRKMVWDAGQILTKESLKYASIYKVAEMIYGSLGDDYADDKKNARIEFEQRLNESFPIVDLNATARIQRNVMPIQDTYSRLVRS